MISRILGWLGMALAAGTGATIALWASAPYPVSTVERRVLTPMLRPGDALKVEVVVDRTERCESEAIRFVQEPDGDRPEVRQPYSASFGRIGRDIFVVSIPTREDTPFGPAEVVTIGRAICNPWHRYVKPVQNPEPSIDRFMFAPETVRVQGKYEGQYTR